MACPDGTFESKAGFATRREAESWGQDQEASIRRDDIDPKVGQITSDRLGQPGGTQDPTRN